MRLKFVPAFNSQGAPRSGSAGSWLREDLVVPRALDHVYIRDVVLYDRSFLSQRSLRCKLDDILIPRGNQRLPKCNHKTASALHLRYPSIVQILYQTGRRLRFIVPRAQLPTVIYSPPIYISLLGQGHTEPITDRHLRYMSPYLLDAVGGQEFAEGARTPQKQIALL